MKQYTILHTIESGGPGGAETVVLNLVKRLNPERFKSIVLLPPGPWLNPRLRELGVPVIEVSWKSWWDLRGPLAMVKAIRKHKVDLIHSHLPGQNFYSCIAGSIAGTKALVTYHGPVELERSENFRGRVRLWVVRNLADRVIVVCDLVKRLLIQKGFSSDRISLVYNGIDSDFIADPRREALRHELKLEATHKLIGMIANVRQSKGYEYYVKACAKVCKDNPNVTFLAIGDVNEQLAVPIKALHSRLSLGDRFRFLGFRSDVSQILREIDIFVLASTSEGMPLSILEAMAAGKPVVTTDCGGIPEMVDHGRTGWLVPPADPDALALAISELLKDAGRGKQLGEGARDKFFKEFTLNGMIERYEKLYLSSLGKG
ncbi:MAG: glycosyltransferase [Nitrospiraceae bacterium]